MNSLPSVLQEKFRGKTSLGVVSYSAYNTHGCELLDNLRATFGSLCIFPFHQKEIGAIDELCESEIVPVRLMEVAYGTMSSMSRIYAFESFLSSLLSDQLKVGVVCTSNILVARSIMNTLFTKPDIRYSLKALERYPDLYAVYFQSSTSL